MNSARKKIPEVSLSTIRQSWRDLVGYMIHARPAAQLIGLLLSAHTIVKTEPSVTLLLLIAGKEFFIELRFCLSGQW